MKISTICGIKSKYQKLSNHLRMIKSVLEDANQKQETSSAIKEWLQQLKDAVFVLEDILEEYSIESGRLRGLSSIKPNNIMFRIKIGNRLKDITQRIDEIAERKKMFCLQERVIIVQNPNEVAEWRQTSPKIHEPVVYGRDDDRDKIVEFLLNNASHSESLSVYPIVGFGGFGKTTLAQLVYNDPRVDRNFITKVWVCVSETFSVNRILCSIIESVTDQKFDASNLNVIQRKVHDLLRGKKYLLVLDDVWNKNQELKFGLSQEKWNKLKSVLSCGSKGSSIIVSTRDTDVAEIMGTCPAHHLSGLKEKECWLLFRQHAFTGDREEQKELVAIGKEIVNKCGGSPLAAQVLGGLMRSRSGEKQWLEIKESNLWTLSDDNLILRVLRLSYFHLTPTLKQCFAFCAIFPKDMKILKEDLIHLWMANGFISSRENLEVEDVGDMIWNELCQKSFFQDIKMNDYSGNITFKMHDLVHDLAQSIMGKECMYLENANMTNLSKNTHHISFIDYDDLSFNEGAIKTLESLRTLFHLELNLIKGNGNIPTNRSLRVLCTAKFQLSSLGNLIHLRYLALYDLDIKTLPDSFYNLKKLEILKLIWFPNLICLPKSFVCLKSLRHLVIEECYSMSSMFPYIEKLCCLRTLNLYIVKSEKGHSLAELNHLNLGGKLEIIGLQDVGSLSEAQEANLMGKKDLQQLCLSWCDHQGTLKTPIIDAEQVIEGLKPHTNLKRLKIDCYDGLCFPSWIIILTSLVTLELRGLQNCVHLSSLSKLPSLKELHLYSLKKVQYMDDGMEMMTVFPSLEKLYLNDLPNLEGLLKVEREKMFPCLSILKIKNCPNLELLLCLPSIKELTVYGCNNELLVSISSFYGLRSLEIGGREGITSFPEGMFRNLTCLQSLRVECFPNLKELPNEPYILLALEHLVIDECKEMEYLPEQIWVGMQSLRTIEIGSCERLKCLPEGIRYLISLEFLRISNCYWLEYLPEQSWEGMQSLRTLAISHCERLKCLPEGIRHLNSLEHLYIYGCPTLEERCKEGIGEDWKKIAHIPYLKIGYGTTRTRA